jgi:peptidoglycan LD-endopeptidase CwlK
MNEHVLSTCVSMQIKVMETVRICQDHFDLTILPYCGLRTCEEQAKIYRKSRSKEQIEQKCQNYIDRGFPVLAEVLKSVGPQVGSLGTHFTMAGPGESWHQFAEAMDCVPTIGGKAIWSAKEPEWEIFGWAAEHAGLQWSGRWKKFKETAHIQLRQGGNPLTSFSSEQALIEALTKAKSLPAV